MICSDKTFAYPKQVSRIYKELWQDKNTITGIPAKFGKKYVELGYEPTAGVLKGCDYMKMYVLELTNDQRNAN